MHLIFGFWPGDSVSIAGHHFTIDTVARCLTDADGVSHRLSGTAISPVPDVRVHVADPQRWPGRLSLAFQAPRDVLLLRHAGNAGGLQ